MKFEDILTFVTIVEQGGVQNAANHLFVSQSTVSNRLMSLETSLNTILIDRGKGKRNLILTKKGEEFLDYAREFLYLENAVQEWSAKTPRAKLRVATIDSFSSTFLLRFYCQIMKETHLLLEISHHWTDRIYSLLENYTVDLGIVPRLFNSKQVVSKPLFEEEMVIVSREKLPPTLHPRDLDPANEIYMDWGTPFVAWHDKWFMPNIAPRIIVDITAPLLEALTIEKSWAFVPISVFNAYANQNPSVQMSKVCEMPPKRIGYLATRHDVLNRKHSAFRNFENHLHKFILDCDFLNTV